MISSLIISNYALIRQLEIKPDKGLNMITGETGAGKSIMLGAVGLLLGKRADVKALLNKNVKCIVEGEFELGELALEEFFDEADVDFEPTSIIRREINPNGKSRAFINDTPVTLDVLKLIGLRLIDIHSQNESISLNDKSIKMKIIDDFAQSGQSLLAYNNAYRKYSSILSELEQLLKHERDSKQDEEYKRFLLEELVNADLKVDELSQLEEEVKLLENAEDIKLKLSRLTSEFEHSDLSLNDKLRESSNTLKSVSSFSEDLSKLGDRLDSAIEEVVDVIHELTRAEEGIEHDPERIEIVNQRLDLIYRLQQKHHVNDVQDLLNIQVKLEEETTGLLSLEETILALKEKLEDTKRLMVKTAEVLSEKRRKSIDNFSTALNDLLKEVGMPDGQFEIAYKRVEPWAMGIDEVEFLFSANKGIRPEPIGRVASGGEFSRLMFCVKYLLAQKTAMPTVIFDEIDTGVSGEIAIKMATMMKKMSSRHQIIAISHLPQVAAKGDEHFFVYKDNQSETTESLIKRLEEQERLEEIAKMIGGDELSETSLNSARALIGKN